jgi:hypothetical protein
MKKDHFEAGAKVECSQDYEQVAEDAPAVCLDIIDGIVGE